MMEQSEPLRRLVAQFFEVAPEQVTPRFPLAGPRLQGSVARYSLDAAIRRQLGVACPSAYTATTYGELEADFLGKPAPFSQPLSAHTSLFSPGSLPFSPADSSGAAMACGIDIELVANLPEAIDYWTNDFYAQCFTPSEIAYCLTQDNPRLHFAGRWCAKEAAKKCAPQLLEQEMKHLEVVRTPSGGIILQLLGQGPPQRLSLAVSLSHTDLMAVAIVVSLNAVPASTAFPSELPDPGPSLPLPSPSARSGLATPLANSNSGSTQKRKLALALIIFSLLTFGVVAKIALFLSRN